MQRSLLTHPVVRSLVFALVVTALCGSLALLTTSSSEALPPNGSYTLYYDDYPEYGGKVVGKDGVDCEGFTYSWGQQTIYYERGRDECGLA